MKMVDEYTYNKHMDTWKMKKLMKDFEAATGDANSMISLIMPQRGEISGVASLLGDELDAALVTGNQSLLLAIRSALQRLRRYDKDPRNGLVLYSGTIVTDDGKEKKVTIDFEPYRPIYASVYECDNKFHTDALSEVLETDEKFGFIVMDDKGTLFATLSGNTVEDLHKFTVTLPPKYVIGGQSAFLMGKRHNYVRRAAKLATQYFINPATGMRNVSGVVLAGSADFHTELSQSDMFDSLLKEKILKSVEVSYGGEDGLNQAINLSYNILADVKLMHEKYAIRLFLKRIAALEWDCVVGVDDTLDKLDQKVLQYIIVWENLDINRYVLKNSITSEIIVKHLNMEEEADESNFRDSDTDAELEVEEKMSLLEWLAYYSDYKKSRCRLVFVANRFQEGSQFCRAFGGIGGIYIPSIATDTQFCRAFGGIGGIYIPSIATDTHWPVYDDKKSLLYYEETSDEENIFLFDEENSDEENFHLNDEENSHPYPVENFHLNNEENFNEEDFDLYFENFHLYDEESFNEENFHLYFEENLHLNDEG